MMGRCSISNFAVLLMATLIPGFGPALAGSSQQGLHWQQGHWFSYPLEYRTPWIPEVDVPLITSRPAMERALAAAPGRTGYVADGAYDPTLVTGTEATMAFAFHVDDLRPVDRNLFFDPDFVTGGPVVQAEILWAGPLVPSPDSVRYFEVAEARGLRPVPMGEGRLAPYEDVPFEGDPARTDYRLLEQAGPLHAMLRCNVADRATGAPELQPLCDGPVWDTETNTVLYLTFPAHLATASDGWAKPANQALKLIDSWRLDD